MLKWNATDHLMNNAKGYLLKPKRVKLEALFALKAFKLSNLNYLTT